MITNRLWHTHLSYCLDSYGTHLPHHARVAIAQGNRLIELGAHGLDCWAQAVHAHLRIYLLTSRLATAGAS